MSNRLGEPMDILSTKKSVNIDLRVVFRTCNNILDKWGGSLAQKARILGMTEVAYQKINDTPRFTNEQQDRLSYILNIHHALCSIFSNPDNIEGFMTMINNNPYFKGRTPLSLIETGDIKALKEVFMHIDVIQQY